MAVTVYSPPVATYTAVATTTLPSSTASVTFSSIPATDTNGNTIRDLVLVMSFDQVDSGFAGKVYANGDTTSSNYVGVRALGNGSTYVSNSNGGSIRWEAQGTNYQTAQVEFLDAKATDKYKLCLVRANAYSSLVEFSYSLWKNTNAITSLTVQFGTNLGAGTTISIYAVVN